MIVNYYAVGMYDRGDYFADNPLKACGFTSSDPKNRNAHVMFYSTVIIGRSYILTAEKKDLMATPEAFYSVIGKHSHKQNISFIVMDMLILYLFPYASMNLIEGVGVGVDMNTVL
ncbi:hypothetical protein I4U23_027220 [Adineta vaga]|nr:hypothetical protein I4U23_027220 [Adineta vaga]